MLKPAKVVTSFVHRTVTRSVFRRLPRGSSMDSVLAMMFHRLSATLYFIYAVWAVVAVIAGIPSLVTANGTQWQTLFSIAVFIFALPSCIGATFWPTFARLELYSGVLFTTLLFIYIFFLVGNALYHEGSWSGLVIIASVLVVPLVRLLIVCMFLLEQTNERKERVAAYLAELNGES